jgi:hypothetical protein
LPENDNYDDEPTTPLSDYTDTSLGESFQSEPTVGILARKSSNATLDPAARLSELQLHKLSKHLSSAKSELQELKYYKDRFKLVQKYADKIRKFNNPTTPSKDFLPVRDSLKPTQSNIKSDNLYSQKTMMAETRLSSQLIRLDSLVNSSLSDQTELLLKLENIQNERNIKDKRYSEMIGVICHVSPETVDELITKSDSS